MRVHWTRAALEDLQSIRDFVAGGDVAAAKRVIGRLLQSVRILARLPAVGRPGRVRETRELVVSDQPYIVAYRVVANSAEILRVLHTSRRWPRRL
jgi:addiction module RelE/StbE family toxin